MFNRAYSATVRVSWRRRGDTISAPIPDTFSCERVRTDHVGVTPHGAHVRRSTGRIRNPVSSRQIRWPPRRARVFYPGPVLLDPLAPAAIVALFGAWLGPLRTEATRPEHELNERKSAPYSRPERSVVVGHNWAPTEGD